MREIRILNLCHKKSILVDIYRQSLLIIRVEGDLEHARNEKYNLIRAIKYSVTGNVSFLTQPD